MKNCYEVLIGIIWYKPVKDKDKERQGKWNGGCVKKKKRGEERKKARK